MRLPKGWVDTGLLEIVELHDNRRIPLNQSERAANPGHYPYYGANGQVDTVGEYLFEGEHILLAEDGGYFDQPHRGVAYQVDGRFWVNNHAHILSALGDIPASFIRRALNCIDWMKFVSGTTRLKLTQAGMQRIRLSLPPLAEQRRIVARLDALTAGIARAREELDRVPVTAAHFRRTALVACFSGDPDTSIELKTLLRAIESGKNLRCDERVPREGENGVVKVSAVTWGQFDATQSKTLPADYVPPERSRIRKDDLLISRANTLELVGAVVVVESEPRDLFLSDKILRLVVDDPDKRWIMWFLRSPDGRKQIEASATGNQLSMRNISQDALRRIRLPFPDITTRKKQIQRLEAAFAHVDRLEAEAVRARMLLDRLESSILAKAFRGELVPQDDNDEPASVLLDRVREERASRLKNKVRPFRRSNA